MCTSMRVFVLSNTMHQILLYVYVVNMCISVCACASVCVMYFGHMCLYV